MIQIPNFGVIVTSATKILWLSPDGETKNLTSHELMNVLSTQKVPPLYCHRNATIGRIKGVNTQRSNTQRVNIQAGFDVLELFAFVRPAEFCVPTPLGLATFFELDPPTSMEEEAMILIMVVQLLLEELKNGHNNNDVSTARFMLDINWIWAYPILNAMNLEGEKPSKAIRTRNLRISSKLKQWEDMPPPPPPSFHKVEADEARRKLSMLLGDHSENRSQQRDYTTFISQAFNTPDNDQKTNIVLAEAGTGTGKTLGYIAPASVWAEKNNGTVWISTYTRNLQRQLYKELTKLYPNPQEKRKNVVIRKGRENYICLLNYSEAINQTIGNQRTGIALGLVSRWILATQDGDIMGGDFPAWLRDLLGYSNTSGLSDRRGECIFSACPQYKQCFVEKNIRRSYYAHIVVANHAICLIRATQLSPDELPTHYIFDEGHHLFTTADNTFATKITGIETSDLRRWLLGSEFGKKSRTRSIKTRLSDLVSGDEQSSESLQEVLHTAQFLPRENWQTRLFHNASPNGECEEFLFEVGKQVVARNPNHGDSPYSMETDVFPVDPNLLRSAKNLQVKTSVLISALKKLHQNIDNYINDNPENLDENSKLRLETILNTIRTRALDPLQSWVDMLSCLELTKQSKIFIDWFILQKHNGKHFDCGFHRHWLDPSQPLSAVILNPSSGIIITSATLNNNNYNTTTNDTATTTTDTTNQIQEQTPPPQDMEDTNNEDTNNNDNWTVGHYSAGVTNVIEHNNIFQKQFTSPFDYQKQALVLIITDLQIRNIDRVASAYKALFKSSNGGGLGVFTAINRLKAVHERIATDLENSHIPLLAQHVDDMDIGTLTDIFSMEKNSCLLGVDAIRDGVDVPGDSLRLLVFDKIPWGVPNILHKNRRKHWKTRMPKTINYDHFIAKFRLKQAFGRLIRTQTDRGIFICLDNRLSTNLTSAFPKDIEIKRVGLADACKIVKNFTNNTNNQELPTQDSHNQELPTRELPTQDSTNKPLPENLADITNIEDYFTTERDEYDNVPF